MELISKDYILKKPEWKQSIIVRLNRYGYKSDVNLFQFEDAAILGVKNKKIVNASWDLIIKDTKYLGFINNRLMNIPFKKIELIISYSMYYTDKNNQEVLLKSLKNRTASNTLNGRNDKPIQIIGFIK